MAAVSRVLVVDDEILIANTLADMLKGRTTQVDCAHSYDEAAQLLERQPHYDVAFIDLMLGKAPHGVELARKAVGLGIQVVAMTGYSALPPGLDGTALLTKPFSLEAVRLIFDTVTRGRP